MQKGLKIDGTMRALAIAFGGAAVMSVVAMFIPPSVFETITGSTGISEIVPATGAPLGDTARAIIAFLFGAITFAVLSAFLLRRPVKSDPRYSAAKPAHRPTEAIAANASDAPSFIDRMRAKIAAYVENRRNADSVTDLSDLPKLRSGDAHPDAPPRRPISAHRDFGEVPTEMDAPILLTPPDETPVELAQAGGIELPASVPLAEAVFEQPAVVDDAKIASMVDRLESAVAQRQHQIDKLEAIVSANVVEPVYAPLPVPAPEPIMPEAVETEITTSTPRPITLGAFPSEPVAKPSEADEMDAALRSALETLHRMNARTR